MLGLICPSTYMLLAMTAGVLLFVVLPASVQPRLDFRSHRRFPRAAARPLAPMQAAPLF